MKVKGLAWWLAHSRHSVKDDKVEVRGLHEMTP